MGLQRHRKLLTLVAQGSSSVADLLVGTTSVKSFRWRWRPIAPSAATSTWTIRGFAGSAGTLVGWLRARARPAREQLQRTRRQPPPQLLLQLSLTPHQRHL